MEKINYKKIKKEYDLLHKKRFEERIRNSDGNVRFVLKDKMNTEWHKIVQSFLESNSIKNKSVLEIGCGYGSLSVYLSKLGGKVTGVDISSEAIKISKKNAMLFNQKIKYLESNAINLPFKDNSFDLVVCCDTLEHIPDYNKAIDEIIRVSKSSGKIIITTPNLFNPKGIYYKLNTNQPFENNFTYFSIINRLKKKDLGILSIESREFFGDKSQKLRRIENLIKKTPLRVFGLRVGVLARKY